MDKVPVKMVSGLLASYTTENEYWANALYGLRNIISCILQVIEVNRQYTSIASTYEVGRVLTVKTQLKLSWVHQKLCSQQVFYDMQ